MKGALNCIHDEGGTKALYMNANAYYKTMARTASFSTWVNAHRPEGFRVSDHELLGTKHPLFEKKDMRLPAHCGRKSESSESPTLLLPLHDVYLRHYRFYSLSEFMESRGAYNVSATGIKVNPCNHVIRLNVNIAQLSFTMLSRYAFDHALHTNMIAKRLQEYIYVTNANATPFGRPS
jgi:hypothetical protein